MYSDSAISPIPRKTWLLYVGFVIYGSLVPLDFRSRPLQEAIELFLQIPMLNLGVESRADWFANGILYIPVGFLTAYLLIQRFSNSPKILLCFLAGLFSIALATGVEFTQIFFPPRTVSLNDLLAECIGSFIGLILAAKYSNWFKALLDATVNSPRQLARHLLEAYLAAYIAYSFFPYDILFSVAELQQKLQGDLWGWFLAGYQQETILTILKSTSEIILTLPFGVFLGYRSSQSRPISFSKAMLFGTMLGALIEIGQLFTASGVSQGLSVLTRIAGTCGGLAIWHQRIDHFPQKIAAHIRHFAIPLGLVYLLVLLQLNGWFSHQWNSADFALLQLKSLHYQPFYYHYYTRETKALSSLAFVYLMYLPIAAFAWALRWTAFQSLFFGFLSACTIEAGKLFLQGMHPDPTNIALGTLAVCAATHFAQKLSAYTPAPLPSKRGKFTQAPPTFRPMAASSTPRKTLATLIPILGFVTYWAVTFPTTPVLLLIFLTASALIMWYRPAFLLLIPMAALPVLDLAPLSGRFYLDEFDLLLVVALVIGHARVSCPKESEQRQDRFFALTTGLVALSFAISALVGLTPWQTPDANAFTNYYSPYNALRIGKGVLWAFLFYGILKRMVGADIDVHRPFAWGMVIGLALTVTVVLWERLAFTGLLSTSSSYRVIGPISAMHTGGAYIECYLAIATPFLLVLIFQVRNWHLKIWGSMLLLATTYALMVTFSRNGYFAFGIASVVMLAVAMFNLEHWRKHIFVVLALVSAMSAVAIPFFTGKYAQERISTLASDFDVRTAHWKDALDIRTPDWSTTLFGMGLGRYPESHYLLSREGHASGTYRLMDENNNTFLRLSSGDSIYVEQVVSVEPKQQYILKLDVRANKPDSKITIPICEKWLLTSFNCIWLIIEIGHEPGAWQHVEKQFNTDQLSDSMWYAQRPAKLALFNNNPKTVIDIDNIRLKHSNGEEHLLNGSFSDGMDHWFFSADSHLQWHIKSMPVAILFDQGWFGLIAIFLFSTLALKRAAAQTLRGDMVTTAALASFCAFLVVGLFDTLIDAPRFLFVFLILGWLCGFHKAGFSKYRKS